jgi:peptide chain release factor 1
VISDNKKYAQLSKEFKDLEEIDEAYHRYKNVLDNIDSSKEILRDEKDEEFREMAKQELLSLEKEQEGLQEKVKFLLVPKDPEDSKNAILEIRAGTGGDEASIFAGDLFRMYSRFCDAKGWKIELVDVSEGTSGGFKEVIFNVTGANVYGDLKYEAGVHRVQRVPQTETQGRVHTSAATVMVLPEAEEFDVEVKESDLRVDSFCSSGPGGQSVNTTYSAIRLTHLPTGIVAQCQDQKSKMKNYDKALSVLRSRIYEIELQKRLEEEAKFRKTMVASGDRSAKIRTYNYAQGRVTDHRINLTLYSLGTIMDGDIGDIIDALKLADNTEKLKAGTQY